MDYTYKGSLTDDGMAVIEDIKALCPELDTERLSELAVSVPKLRATLQKAKINGATWEDAWGIHRIHEHFKAELELQLESVCDFLKRKLVEHTDASVSGPTDNFVYGCGIDQLLRMKINRLKVEDYKAAKKLSADRIRFAVEKLEAVREFKLDVR